MRPILLSNNQKTELYSIRNISAAHITDVINVCEYELDHLSATPEDLTQALRFLWLENLAKTHFNDFDSCIEHQAPSHRFEINTNAIYNPFQINESLIRASRSMKPPTEAYCSSGALRSPPVPSVAKVCKFIFSLAAGASTGAFIYLNYRHEIYKWGAHLQNKTRSNPTTGELVEWFTLSTAGLLTMALMLCAFSQFKVCEPRQSEPVINQQLLPIEPDNEFYGAIKSQLSRASAEVQGLRDEINKTSMIIMLTKPNYHLIIQLYICALARTGSSCIDIQGQKNGIRSNPGRYPAASSGVMFHMSGVKPQAGSHDGRINSTSPYNVV